MALSIFPCNCWQNQALGLCLFSHPVLFNYLLFHSIVPYCILFYAAMRNYSFIHCYCSKLPIGIHWNSSEPVALFWIFFPFDYVLFYFIALHCIKLHCILYISIPSNAFLCHSIYSFPLNIIEIHFNQFYTIRLHSTVYTSLAYIVEILAKFHTHVNTTRLQWL